MYKRFLCLYIEFNVSIFISLHSNTIQPFEHTIQQFCKFLVYTRIHKRARAHKQILFKLVKL